MLISRKKKRNPFWTIHSHRSALEDRGFTIYIAITFQETAKQVKTVLRWLYFIGPGRSQHSLLYQDRIMHPQLGPHKRPMGKIQVTWGYSQKLQNKEGNKNSSTTLCTTTTKKQVYVMDFGDSDGHILYLNIFVWKKVKRKSEQVVRYFQRKTRQIIKRASRNDIF